MQFEVDFLLFYAQKERNLSETDGSKMVRGVGFELPIFDYELSRQLSIYSSKRTNHSRKLQVQSIYKGGV